MNKISFVFMALSLVFMLGCAQQIETPQPSSAVPAPGSEGVKETIVVEEPQPQPQMEEKPKQGEPKETVKEITMTAKRFDFNPPTITADQGDRIRITITSLDVTHGFSLPDFNINERLEPNQPVTVEFIADKTGTFEFRCSVYCGSGHGSMRGTLIVK